MQMWQKAVPSRFVHINFPPLLGLVRHKPQGDHPVSMEQKLFQATDNVTGFGGQSTSGSEVARCLPSGCQKLVAVLAPNSSVCDSAAVRVVALSSH